MTREPTPSSASAASPELARFALVLAGALATLLPAADASAQTWLGARLTGFAQARRALARGSDALVINPAGLALSPVYTVELGYADDFRESDRRFHASITDGQAGPVAGGIGYTYGTARPSLFADEDDRLEGHRIEGALAFGVFEGAALGFNVRGLIFDAQPVDGGGGDDLEELTFDLGFQWQVNQQVAVAVTGQNLTNIQRAEAPLLASAAVGLTFDAFTIESDVSYNAFFSDVLVALGAGYTFAKVVPVRAGFVYDLQQEEAGISFGAGIALGRFGLDLAYIQRITNIDQAQVDDDERVFVASMRVVVF